VSIVGSGDYKIGGEVALRQQMTLDLQVWGGPVQHFASGVVPLTITTETGFYPHDIDPQSTDRRFLGVWVEVKTGPAATP